MYVVAIPACISHRNTPERKLVKKKASGCMQAEQ
jgi:hypothetical protein